MKNSAPPASWADQRIAVVERVGVVGHLMDPPRQRRMNRVIAGAKTSMPRWRPSPPGWRHRRTGRSYSSCAALHRCRGRRPPLRREPAVEGAVGKAGISGNSPRVRSARLGAEAISGRNSGAGSEAARKVRICGLPRWRQGHGPAASPRACSLIDGGQPRRHRLRCRITGPQSRQHRLKRHLRLCRRHSRKAV